MAMCPLLHSYYNQCTRACTEAVPATGHGHGARLLASAFWVRCLCLADPGEGAGPQRQAGSAVRGERIRARAPARASCN